MHYVRMTPPTKTFVKKCAAQLGKASFLSQPLENRIKYIEQLRAKSEQAKSSKSMQIMDVNTDAVEDLLKQYDYPPLFIHGHTHRPKVHEYLLAGHACKRVVLGDWYEQGSYLMLNADGCHSRRL